MRNNAKKFLVPENFIALDTSGTNTNVIEVGYLEYAAQSDSTDLDTVMCSIQGEELKRILPDQIDDVLSFNTFVYTSTDKKDQTLKIVVDKVKVKNSEDAKKFITGILVDYRIAPVTYAGTEKDKIYQCNIHLSDMTLVNEMKSCTINDIISKAQTLESGLNVNGIGWYDITFRRALIQG